MFVAQVVSGRLHSTKLGQDIHCGECLVFTRLSLGSRGATKGCLSGLEVGLVIEVVGACRLNLSCNEAQRPSGMCRGDCGLWSLN